jgi:hypothetical protein
MKHGTLDECERQGVGQAHMQWSPGSGPPGKVHRSGERALNYDAEQLNFGGTAKVSSRPNNLAETRVLSDVWPPALSCGSGPRANVP